MSIERLAQLLAESAADVRAPSFAEAAWARAHQVRRRRRVVGSSVVATVVAAAVGFSLVGPPGGGVPVAPPSATGKPTLAAPRPSHVDRVPADLPAYTKRVPLPKTYPRFADVPPISQREGAPGSGLALYEPGPAENATKPEPVYLYREPGEWVRLDTVDLAFATDGANLQVPLDSTSLSPDGSLAAFAQQDELVIVELTKGEVTRIPVPGFNEHVFWRPGPAVLVVQSRVSHLVDLATRRVERMPYAGWNMVSGYDDPPRLGYVEFSGESTDGPGTLDVWAPGNTTPERRIPIEVDMPQYAITGWYGAAWRADNRVVRAGWGNSGTEFGMEVVAMIDLPTGHVDRILAFGMDRVKGCCEVLGWLDPDTVLLRNDPFGLVAWERWTGRLAKVADSFDGTVAVRDVSS